MPKWFNSLTLQCSCWLQSHLALTLPLLLGTAEKCNKTPYLLCQFQTFVIQSRWQGFPHFPPLFLKYEWSDDVWGRLNKATRGKPDGHLASEGNLLAIAGFTLQELKVALSLFAKNYFTKTKPLQTKLIDSSNVWVIFWSQQKLDFVYHILLLK